ncbi:hypothetical protein [Gilvibacter sp.]|uniref:hypothetical protein n=1 Tax=Gilvibacter sp. TaxID=2729997 RepID=UPI003F4A1E5A
MSFGVIQAMVTSLKNNKRNRKTRFDKKESLNSSTYGKFEDYKKFNPAQMAAFQKKVKEARRKLFLKQLFVFSVIFSVIVGFFYYMMFVR